MNKIFFILFLLSCQQVFGQTQINVALPTYLSVASASSTYNTGGVTYPAGNTILGDNEHFCGQGGGCGTANGWASASLPANIVIDFQRTVPVNEIDVFNVQDMFGMPNMPTSNMQCTLYCNTAYTVNYWTGSAWSPVPGGTFSCTPGTNCFVWNKITLSSTISTTKIQVSVTANVTMDIARVVAVQAWYSYTPLSGPTTYTSNSCNWGDVISIVNGPTRIVSFDGDVTKIASGNCSWTQGVSFPSGIGVTVMGAGTPDNRPSTSVPSASCATGTTINVSGIPAVFSMAPVVGNSTTRGSCMTLNATGNAEGFDVRGTCTISSGCPDFRLDNTTWTGWTGKSVAYNCSLTSNCIAGVFGVADHNSATNDYSNFLQFIQVHFGQFPDYFGNNSSLGIYGNNSWANPEFYGSNRFFFIENNTFRGVQCCENEAMSRLGTLGGGGRVVVRFNQFLDMRQYAAVVWHGTEDSTRSPRAYEAYGNSYECNEDGTTACSSLVAIRGGTGLVWGNSINVPNGSLFSDLVELDNYRAVSSPSIWGPCDGSNPYDVNDGTTYFSGKITNINGSTLTISDNMGGPSWTPHTQWPTTSPYSLHDLDASGGGSGGTAGGNGAEILDNGMNTLVIVPGAGPAPYSPAINHRIQILRSTACIDQTSGRGRGIRYNDATGSTTYDANGMLPFQSAGEVVSPTYIWLNSIGPNTSCVSSCGVSLNPQTNKILANRDYYIETENQGAQTSPTSPFDGSSGIGHGTKANIPKVAGLDHCTAGTGYFATDEGNWNTSGNGFGNGQLYICGPSSNNVWNLSVTPYLYPHPDTVNNGNSQSFSVQPSNTVSGQAFSPSIRITLTSGAADSITLAVTTGTCTLTGSTTVTSTGGSPNTATFSLSANAIGNNCILTSTDNSDGTVAPITSNSFNVTSGCTPDHLTFTIQPDSVHPGVNFGPISVAIQDVSGNTCTSSTATVSVVNHPGSCIGMTLAPTLSGPASSGVFTAASANETGATGNCMLDASSNGLTGATSNIFALLQGTPGVHGRRKGRP